MSRKLPKSQEAYGHPGLGILKSLWRSKQRSPPSRYIIIKLAKVQDIENSETNKTKVLSNILENTYYYRRFFFCGNLTGLERM